MSFLKLSNLLKIKYLSKPCLKGFENYKYSCIDTSPFSVYVMHPFWNFLVQYFPVWVAPNVLTFIGFLLTFANFLIFTCIDYSYNASSIEEDENSSSIPSWIFFLVAVNFFVAYTLDGIDGKQARRTKTSGPLGELFDHGVDSFASGLIPASMYSIVGRSKYLLTPTRMYCVVWTVLLNFYVTHFEKYTTGVLFLPWAFDLSMLAIVFTYVIASIFGNTINNLYILNLIPVPALCELLVYLSFLSTLPPTVYNIFKSYKTKTGKMHSVIEFLRPLVSIFILMISMYVWVFLSEWNVIEKDPRAFFFLTGIIFSNISCKLIIAQMSNMRCELINVFLIPLIAIILVVRFVKNGFLEAFFLYSFTAVAFFAHFHYAICVVKQLCEHFKIDCFRIKQLPKSTTTAQ